MDLAFPYSIVRFRGIWIVVTGEVWGGMGGDCAEVRSGNLAHTGASIFAAVMSH